ncbi:unnamed protein product [Urochloa decumbens]|uniref:Uncharacterized protein n=1 Tax=Urochloa decumbens TaxID=240449 RepID=A0ABC8ZZ04_9POAL
MQQPGGYYPPGRYGNGNGGGFRHGNGRGPPYRPPAPAPPPEHYQMTPKEKERVLMAAGRLAAEYLVDRGDLPPDALEGRPPAPIPFRQQHGPPAARFQGHPPPQQHRQGFHFHDEFHQGEQQQRRFPGPRQFFHGPFPKRPRHHQGPPRSFPYGPRAPAPPLHNKKMTWYAGQDAAAAAAPPVAESKMQEDEGNTAAAGDAGDSQPTAQPRGAASGAPEQMSEPSSSSLGANDSKSS